MFSTAMTALALVMTIAHHAPLALQAIPDLPVEEEAPETIITNSEPAAAEAEPTLDEIPETSVKTSGPVSIEPVREAEAPTVVVENEAPAPTETAQPDTNETATRVTPLTGADQAAILTSVSDALNAAQTASGKFRQINADGSVSTGEFALRRPGRVRFDYDDPTPILIISDGATVAMEDRDLETVDRIPLASTPLGLLLDDDLDFSSDVDVINVFRNNGRVSVTVQDATGEVEGDLTMIFADETYDLLGWLTFDADFQTTVVELSDVERNQRLNPRLFRLDEDEEDER